jgi:cob(I)alamin adenosyltransferase
MSIYTKTGDKGQTSLLGGKRVSKSCLEMQVIGDIDELNACLGVMVALLSSSQRQRIGEVEGENKEFINFIQSIQRDLFKVGAELASLQTPLEDKINKIDNTRVGEMEARIDSFWAELPELKNFILPGGSLAGAEIHRARTVCRRAERQLVDFSKINSIRSELSIYINRLSDFLFALARFINFKEGVEEIIV